MVASPFSLLRDPGFLRVWGIGLIGNTMRWLELLAIGIFVFETTGSALLVAAMTIARQLPLALFGVFIGPMAERTNRKHLMIFGFAVMTVSTATMGLLAYLGVIEIWQIAICVFISGSSWGLAHFICVLIAISLSLDRTKVRSSAEPYLTMLKQGLNIVRASPELIGVYLVTIILNVFGFPYAAMVPVLGRARYDVEPALVGLLSAAEGAGAFAGALVIAFVARPAWFKRLYLYGAASFMCLIFGLSFAADYWLAVSILLFAGLGMAGFGAMQSTLVLLLAPVEARSRLMGLLSVCIGCSPIGLLNLGLLADWVGAPLALTLVSSTGLLLLAATVCFIPAIRR